MRTLLLHGLGADRSQPTELFAPILTGNWNAPDVRAHGGSTRVGVPEDFSFESLARETVAGLPESTWTIIGISMGAAIALQIAISELLPVQRLVLVRPAFTANAFPPHLSALTTTGDLLGRYRADHASEHFRKTEEYRAVNAVSPSSAAALLENFIAPQAAQRRVRFTAVPGNPSLSDPRVSALDISTLVVATPHDPIHPIEVAEDWVDAISGARLEMSADRNSDPIDFAASVRHIVGAELSR